MAEVRAGLPLGALARVVASMGQSVTALEPVLDGSARTIQHPRAHGPPPYEG